MSHRKELEQKINNMNKDGGKGADEWNMFLLTVIADLLAVIADKMESEEDKE